MKPLDKDSTLINVCLLAIRSRVASNTPLTIDDLGLVYKVVGRLEWTSDCVRTVRELEIEPSYAETANPNYNKGYKVAMEKVRAIIL